MNKKHISAFIITSLLSASAFSAKNNFIGEYHIGQHNAHGTATKNLVSADNAFCFLTKAGVADTDGSSERAICELENRNNTWLLHAVLTHTSDADAYCGAMCYTR